MSSSPRSRRFSATSVPLGRSDKRMRGACLSTSKDERRRERNRAEVVEREDEAVLGGRRRKDIRLQRKLKFVQRATHRSRQPLRARGRGHARWGADEQLVFQPVAQPTQRVARGRLAEMQAFGGAGDAPPRAESPRRRAADSNRESADSSPSFISCIALQLGGKAYKTTHRAARRKRAMRVPLPVPPSREALQPPVRVTSARSITMPVRKSIGANGSTDRKSGPLWSS